MSKKLIQEESEQIMVIPGQRHLLLEQVHILGLKSKGKQLRLASNFPLRKKKKRTRCPSNERGMFHRIILNTQVTRRTLGPVPEAEHRQTFTLTHKDNGRTSETK
jgi:hypothetical protein